MRISGISRLEATEDAEESWAKLVHELGEKGMWNQAKSWYRRANIPGAIAEHVYFSGGMPLYRQACEDSAESGYKGFKQGRLFGST